MSIKVLSAVKQKQAAGYINILNIMRNDEYEDKNSYFSVNSGCVLSYSEAGF